MKSLLPTCLAFLALGSPLFAQGAAKEDAERLRAELQALTQEGKLSSRPSSVDLRPLFPEVGFQTMNDCAAWAFGYYTRSYLEAVDQGWAPDSPSRIFSPSFIYNQVNGGKDEGSNPIEVLELLRDQGAATLETFPYAANDHLKAPPSVSRKEAEVFKIQDYFLVSSGEAMRESLALGRPVCVGIRTNPVFSSGRYSSYTAADHDRGAALRTSGQPHGYHAMVVVGYDDERQAFLFLNSWGTDWGQQGSVWVSYEVADLFNLTERTEGLVDYGLVMVDRSVPVVRDGAEYAEARVEDLTIRMKPDIDSVDGQGRNLFRIGLSLAGPSAARSIVESVQWEYAIDGESVSLPGRESVWTDYFEAFALTTEAKFPVQAHVRLQDGSERVIRSQVEIDPSQFRTVQLVAYDAYFAKHAETGQDQWRWTIEPQLSAREWKALESIEWTYEVDGVERSRRYDHDGSSSIGQDVTSTARLQGVDVSPPSGQARFKFRDGMLAVTALPTTGFQAAAVDGLVISIVKRDEGEFHGQDWYHFDLVATYPEAWKYFVEQAFFTVDGLTQDGSTTVLSGQASIWPAPHSFAVSGYTSQSLDFQAQLNLRLRSFRNEASFDLKSIFAYFSENGTYDSRTLRRSELTTLDLGGALHDLGWTDRYVGIVDGTPTWEYELSWLNRSEDFIDEIEWQLGDGIEFEVKKMFDSVIRPPVVFQAGAQLAVDAKAVDYEENEIATVKREIAARSPMTSAISLDVQSGVEAVLDERGASFSQPLAAVAVVGPEQRLGQIEGIGYLVPSGAGGVREFKIDTLFSSEERNAFQRGRVPARDGAAAARLYFTDQSQMLVSGRQHGFSPFPMSIDLQLEARERFWAIEAGRPIWLVELSLRGKQASLQSIESVTWQAVSEDGGEQAGKLSLMPGQTIEVMTSVPLRFEANLRFAAQTGRPDQQLVAYATTRSEIPSLPLSARWEQTGQDEVQHNPYADPAMMEEPASYFTVNVVGWERELRKIESVEWLETDLEAQEYLDDYEPSRHEVNERSASPLGGFGHEFGTLYPMSQFDGRVRMMDSNEIIELPQITVDDSRWKPALGAKTEVFYWGQDEAGKDSWFVQATYEDESGLARPSETVGYGFEGEGEAPVIDASAPESLQGLLEVDDTGRAYTYSVTRPGFLAELVFQRTRHVRSADRFYVDTLNLDDIPEIEDSNALKDDGRVLTAPLAQVEHRQASVLLSEWGAPGTQQVDAKDRLFNLSVRGPIGDFYAADYVVYELQTAGQLVEVRPFALESWGPERFDTRWIGATPTSVTAKLYRADGSLLNKLQSE